MLTIKQIISAKRPGTVDDSRLDALIELAAQRTSQSVFGANYNLAVALRALHSLDCYDSNQGTSGPVTSRKEGDLAISFGSSGVAGDLGSTCWGVELKQLIKSNCSGPIHQAMNPLWQA